MTTDYHNLLDVQEQLSQDVLWYDSFIQELYLVSGACRAATKTGVLGTADLPEGQTARIRVSFCCRTGSQLFTRGVVGADIMIWRLRSYVIQGIDELSFNVAAAGQSVCLDFSNKELHDRETQFVAEEIGVKLLGREFLGPDHRIGYEFPSSTAATATALVDCWRQCKSCQNAWEEKPSVEYSRCPDCGVVTKLEN